MKYLRAFKIDLKPTLIRLDRGPAKLGWRRYHATTIQQDEEPSIKSNPESQVSSSERGFMTNHEIRESLHRLPRRAKRLDLNEQERTSPEETFISSLDRKGGRYHSRVGSTYAKARSPVYFPNVSMRLVRPSMTDSGDPFTAIFRCDLRLTKPDIFNYLRQIYGVGITSIRTAIYRNRNRRRLKSKVRGSVVIDNKRGDRTFKKVWIGLDKPFFFPSLPKSGFLTQNYNFGDLLNTYNRYKLLQAEKAKLDPSQVLPAGLPEKGTRVNVFRDLLDQKQLLEPELDKYIQDSLTSFTPDDDDDHPSDSVPPAVNPKSSKPSKL